MSDTGAYAPQGLHVLADLLDADPARLADAAGIEREARRAAELAGATVLRSEVHGFGPGQGVAGVVLLAESHLTFHTWPEHGYAALDAFMCGACRPQLAIDHLVQALGARSVRVQTVERGRVSVQPVAPGDARADGP